MSLVTRCPACSTAFKVVRDQLRISEGWVRCGRCSEVFDATLDLQDTEGDEPDSVPVAAPPDDMPRPPAAGSPEAPAPDLSLPAPPASGWIEGADMLADPSDEGNVVEETSAPQPVAPTPAWPARDLLELAPTATPAASPTDASPDEPAGAGSVSQSLSTALPAGTGAWTRASGWLPLPSDLPAIVADEPWPLTAASRASPDDVAAPSGVDQAVNAQLQKALRRTRIQTLRAARARARTDARAEAQRVEAAPPALLEEGDGLSSSAALPAVPGAAPVPEATLRQASEEPQAPEAAALAPVVPSFLEAGTPIDGPKTPQRAALLLAFAVFAALLLVLQVLRHERDSLAATQPALRPVLSVLCQLSGCEMSPLRRLDAIRIDGSSFTPDREGGGYRLQFSLRNASPTALAMPAVELSLLDGNERPVVRRVLQPAEFGAPAVLGPRAEHAATLPLALKPPAGSNLPAVVGYSVMAFYP